MGAHLSTSILCHVSGQVVYYQLHAGARLAGALPGISYLHQLLRRSLSSLPPGDVAGRTAAVRAFGAGSRASLRLHRASPLAAVSGPLLQLPVFASFVIATRGLVDAGAHGLDEGEGGSSVYLMSICRPWAIAVWDLRVRYAAL